MKVSKVGKQVLGLFRDTSPALCTDEEVKLPTGDSETLFVLVHAATEGIKSKIMQAADS